VGDVCKDVANGRITVLSVSNAYPITELVNRMHVAEPFRQVAKRVKALVSRKIRWKSIPRGVRRGILYHAARKHAANRRTFVEVMGRQPLPSPRMVAEAVGQAMGIPYPG
jgi:hypothetical protein